MTQRWCASPSRSRTSVRRAPSVGPSRLSWRSSRTRWRCSATSRARCGHVCSSSSPGRSAASESTRASSWRARRNRSPASSATPTCSAGAARGTLSAVTPADGGVRAHRWRARRARQRSALLALTLAGMQARAFVHLERGEIGRWMALAGSRWFDLLGDRSLPFFQLTALIYQVPQRLPRRRARACRGARAGHGPLASSHRPSAGGLDRHDAGSAVAVSRRATPRLLDAGTPSSTRR